jgi:hypothetical protein
MAKKAKYHAQELTDEDKRLIGQISLKFAAKLFALISKYPNPKDYAEEVILKDVHSKNYSAGVHMLAIIKNATSNRTFKPHEINQKLANIIRNYDVQQDVKSSVLLDPSSLRRVLKDHEESGTLLHLTKKDEIKEFERETRRPGKKTSSDQDNGGKPSAYLLTEELQKMKNVMEKPGAKELFYMQIDIDDLAYKLMKYIMLAVLHAAKTDENALSTLLSFGAAPIQHAIKKEDILEFNAKHQWLLDHNHLEEFVNSAAEDFVRSHGFDKFLIAAFGLFKL